MDDMPKNSQIQNAKPVAKLLEAVHDVIERDINLGLYKPEMLRLTVEARKEVVKQLTDQGLSTREIAKIMGTTKSTVHRDLIEPNEENCPKTGQKPPHNGAFSKSKQLEEERIEQVKPEVHAEEPKSSPPPKVIGADGKSYTADTAPAALNFVEDGKSIGTWHPDVKNDWSCSREFDAPPLEQKPRVYVRFIQDLSHVELLLWVLYLKRSRRWPKILRLISLEEEKLMEQVRSNSTGQSNGNT
jgi:transposase